MCKLIVYHAVTFAAPCVDMREECDSLRPETSIVNFVQRSSDNQFVLWMSLLVIF